jgi:thioredoxin
MSMVTPLDDSDFAEHAAAGETPVLVDFWAPWCGVCRMLAPVLERIAEEHAGHLRVVKVDVEQSPETASRFTVSGLPTLVLLADGEPVRRFAGAVRPQQLRDALRDYLS